MEKRIEPLWYILAFLAAAVHLLYVWVFRDLVVEGLTSKGHLADYLAILYPSIKDKLLTGNIAQIIERADSFVWRIWLLLLFAFLLFNSFLKLEFNSEKAEPNSSWFLFSWHWVQAFFVFDLWIDLQERGDYVNLFQPLPPWSLLFIPFPSTLILWCMALIYVLGLYLIFKSGFSWLGSWICWSIFLVFQILQLGFGKLEHTYISFTFASFWIVLFTTKSFFGYLSLARLSIGLCYLFSGTEKLLLGGKIWLTTGALSAIVEDGSFLQSLMKNHVWVESGLQYSVLLFQLSAPFLSVSKRYYKQFALFALIFHLSTYSFLNIGGLVSPWMAALLVFIIPISAHQKPI